MQRDSYLILAAVCTEMSHQVDQMEFAELNSPPTGLPSVQPLGRQGCPPFSHLLSCLLLVLTASHWAREEVRLQGLQQHFNSGLVILERSLKANALKTSKEIKLQFDRLEDSVHIKSQIQLEKLEAISSLIKDTDEVLNLAMSQQKKSEEIITRSLNTSTGNVRSEVQNLSVSVMTHLAEVDKSVTTNISLLAKAVASLDAGLEEATEKLLDQIEEKTLLTFNHTIGIHESLAMLLKNKTWTVKEEIMQEIRNRSETMVLLQIEVKATSDSLREQGSQLTYMQDSVMHSLIRISNMTYRLKDGQNETRQALGVIKESIEENLSNLQSKSCPTNWEKVAIYSPNIDTCMKYINQSRKFPEAKLECQKLGGHLPRIRSREENDVYAAKERATWLEATDSGDIKSIEMSRLH